MSESSEMNRRAFLTAAAATAAALALPVLPAGADPAPTSAPADGHYDVGPLSSYNKDGVTATWSGKHKGAFFVIRQQGQLYASSSICTHRGCVLTPKPDELFCHCHKSEFSLEGTVTNGPAKRSLERYAIAANTDNHVMVDTTTSFSEAHWDDPASFIPVK